MATATLFDSVAATYDRWYESPANRFVDRYEKEALSAVLPSAPAGSMLLDVGCGTAHWLPQYRAAGYTVIGIDISSEMLSVANTKFGSTLGLARGDALFLPFRDAGFDAVCSLTTLEFVRDRRKCLDEMHRCLKPGGTLVIGVLNARSLLGVKRRLSRSRLFRQAHFFTVGELLRHLSRFGEPYVTTCSFAPPSRFLLPICRWIEAIAAVLLPGCGQLIVASVVKQEH
jgi:ubiquinone/menaquinone biosynthesis C-methylase UbiE